MTDTTNNKTGLTTAEVDPNADMPAGAAAGPTVAADAANGQADLTEEALRRIYDWAHGAPDDEAPELLVMLLRPDPRLDNMATKDDLAAATDGLREALKNHPTLDDLREALKYHPTLDDLAEALKNHPTLEDLAEALRPYATKEEVRTIVREEFLLMVPPLVRAEVNEALRAVPTREELSKHPTTALLDAKLENLATKDDLHEAIEAQNEKFDALGKELEARNSEAKKENRRWFYTTLAAVVSLIALAANSSLGIVGPF